MYRKHLKQQENCLIIVLPIACLYFYDSFLGVKVRRSILCFLGCFFLPFKPFNGHSHVTKIIG